VDDLAGLLGAGRVLAGAETGGQGAQRPGGQLWPVRQREQRRDQAVAAE
jgi:hypothetical protein